MRRGAKPGKAKIDARLSVARTSPKNEGSKVRHLQKRLKEALKREAEALEQQTATSEILRVISGSPTDIAPVFDAIVESAAQLTGAHVSAVFRFDGELMHYVAGRSPVAGAVEEYQRAFPRPLIPGSPATRAILECRVMQIVDVEHDPHIPAASRELARAAGIRSNLQVPMIRDGIAIGLIGVGRTAPVPFTEREVDLLKTFADQAVIAIENVRLFTELQQKNEALTQAHARVTEALDQKTATSDILRVMSSSPTDVQPVFDAIAQNAATVCGADNATVFRFDGTLIHFAADHGWSREELDALQGVFPIPPGRGSLTARAILTRAVAHMADIAADPDFTYTPLMQAGFRTVLSVPMLRDGEPIGAISIGRREVKLFLDQQVELLQTFADQAVIAIENVRLFTELRASNRELTTALDQQTATSDILRVISQSQRDVQPVFDAIVVSAVRLLRAYSGALTRVVGDQIELVAHTEMDDARDDALRAAYPHSLHSEQPHAQVIRDRVPLNVADALTDPRMPQTVQAYARARGFRSAVVVPLLHQDEAVGGIGVSRREAGGFTDDEIALLKTLADQAVIAIDNVRLFNELGARNADLTAALEQQTATSEILSVISSSPTDVQPVFDTIVARAARLCDATHASIYRVDGDALRHMAMYGAPVGGAHLAGVGGTIPIDRASGLGRAVVTRQTVHVLDAHQDPESSDELSALVLRDDVRTVLAVPLLREGTAIGAILIRRTQVCAFTDKDIQLLQTFADQAVIAVENARLFKELQARTTELTRSVSRLTALGEISQAVSSTLDVETVLQTVVSRASQLAGADGCAIYEYDDATEAFHIRATHNLDSAVVATLRATPLRKGEGTMGRAAETREPTQVADIAAPGAYQSHVRDTLLGAGYRALLSVPLLREGQVIGSLSLNRHAPGEFPPEAVEVLKTFATQSALAIQNARLFREIADKSAQLEAASRHKSEFLANMSHELRTPLNAIIGFSEVLVDRMFGELNPKQDEYLKDISASGQHLLSLINDILDLSKIEAGRMELEATDFDLPSAIDNALTLVRERATRRGITLGRTIDERLGTIQGDERKVKQVLLNLLSNALKFTPEGGRIDVNARVHDEVAEVSVADTGVGIAPEDQEAVFEEFRQVGAADRKVEGTGLGLALSRKFIELHGGRIWVGSEVGKGSTFTFTLPVRRED